MEIDGGVDNEDNDECLSDCNTSSDATIKVIFKMCISIVNAIYIYILLDAYRIT